MLLVGAAAFACDGKSELPAATLLEHATQHVVVVVQDERDSTGAMYRYERSGQGWQRVGGPVRASLGAGGVNKTREGDRRSPSGVYGLPAAFGYGERPPSGVRMPYIALRSETECVDDPASPHYNRIIHPSELPHGKAWKSSEMMRRDLYAGDDLYKLGVLVAYNTHDPASVATGPPAGSCIFLHIWRGPDRPTVGCTAFAEEEMVSLLRWLDPTASPVLVQGTRADLQKMLPYSLH